MTNEAYNGKEVIESELKDAKKQQQKALEKIHHIGRELQECKDSFYIRAKMKDLNMWESQLVHEESRIKAFEIALTHYPK